ncbi:MAG: hypothetical protein LBM41_02765 [Ruminococcus sp.]|jgi:hypothetical protein|nr:hypothetical protein [Ruminococcus sp.]
MSAREMVRRDLDFMSERFLKKVYTMWIDEEALENPNAETIEAMENCINERNYIEFNNAGEARAHVAELLRKHNENN